MMTFTRPLCCYSNSEQSLMHTEARGGWHPIQ